MKAIEAIEATVDAPMEPAEAAVREALAKEGFGILTEIDVAATLAAKLGIERPPLKILGACNPRFAHQALELDPAVALLMPCNVVIEPLADGRTRVAVADPRSLVDDPRFAEVGEEAAARITAALEGIQVA